jgi:hypothetical protein
VIHNAPSIGAELGVQRRRARDAIVCPASCFFYDETNREGAKTAEKRREEEVVSLIPSRLSSRLRACAVVLFCLSA